MSDRLRPPAVLLLCCFVSSGGDARAGQSPAPAAGPCFQLRARVETTPRRTGVHFSPDGRLVAGSDDEHTHGWEVASGRLRQKLSRALQATFSPDARTLATSRGGHLSLREVSCR